MPVFAEPPADLVLRHVRLHLEAQEKAQVFEAQERTQRLEHELALRGLEIEAETVKLEHTELQSAAVRGHFDSFSRPISSGSTLIPGLVSQP
ncbi:unnamed protein product [Lota lota]